jgi:hypothetical protein
MAAAEARLSNSSIGRVKSWSSLRRRDEPARTPAKPTSVSDSQFRARWPAIFDLRRLPRGRSSCWDFSHQLKTRQRTRSDFARREHHRIIGAQYGATLDQLRHALKKDPDGKGATILGEAIEVLRFVDLEGPPAAWNARYVERASARSVLTQKLVARPAAKGRVGGGLSVT